MLVNLVDNALRHAGPAANVTVRTLRLSGQAQLSVTDNGPRHPP
jgi:two-component system sensor histidine kinase TctE